MNHHEERELLKEITDTDKKIAADPELSDALRAYLRTTLRINAALVKAASEATDRHWGDRGPLR